MQIDLTKEVADDLTLREALVLSLGTKHPFREMRTLIDIGHLRERMIKAELEELFQMSVLELKYCIGAIHLSNYSLSTKGALLGALDDRAN